MEEKIDAKIIVEEIGLKGCLLTTVIIFCILFVFARMIYLEVTAQRYKSLISGVITEYQEPELFDPAGLIISPAVGLVLADQGFILVKVSNETIKINLKEGVSTINIVGKKALIEEKGKIFEGKKIREELILISIE